MAFTHTAGYALAAAKYIGDKLGGKTDFHALMVGPLHHHRVYMGNCTQSYLIKALLLRFQVGLPNHQSVAWHYKRVDV